jgi:hypothetical protein
VAVAALIGFVAAVPMLGPSIPRAYDTSHHLQEVAAFREALDEGVLFSAWIPDFSLGFGAPWARFYAPLSNTSAIVALLLGFNAIDAYRSMVIVAPILAAVGTYLALRRYTGEAGAMVGAAFYAHSPYFIHDLYIRASIAELYALAWFPWCLWSLGELYQRRSGGHFVAGSIFVGAVVLSHHLMAPLIMATLSVLPFFLGFWRPGSRPWIEAFLRPTAAIAAGLGLSAVYWLSAVSEARDVRLAVEYLGVELFTRSFTNRPLGIALEWPYVHMQIPGVGIHQVGVVLVIIALLILRRAPARGLAVWAMLLVIGSWAIQTRASIPLYLTVTPLQYIQYAFRILSFLSFGVAVLAAIAIAGLPARARLRAGVAVVAVGIAIWGGLGGLDVERVLVDNRLVSVESTIRSEFTTEGFGGSSAGAYLPVYSPIPGKAADARLRMVSAIDPRERDPRPLPERLAVTKVDWRGDSIRFSVESEVAERLMVRQFYFPAWRVSIDGQPTIAAPSPRFGALAFDVPAGRHTVEVWRGWTTWTAIATAISLSIVVVLLVVGSGASRLAVGTVAIVAGCVLFTVSMGIGTGARRVAIDPSRVDGREDRLVVVGGHIDVARLDRDRMMTVGLDTLTRAELSEPLHFVFRVTASDGATHVVDSSQWPLMRALERGTLSRSRHDIRLPPGFAAGPARLTLEMRSTPEAAPHATLELGQVVLPATPSLTAVGASIGQFDTLTIRGARTALSAEVLAAGVLPDQPIDVYLDFEVTGPSSVEYAAMLGLVASSGRHWGPSRALGDWWNTQPGWQRGERMSQQFRLRPPRASAGGSYDLVLRVETTGKSWVDMSDLIPLAARDKYTWTRTVAKVRVVR